MQELIYMPTGDIALPLVLVELAIERHLPERAHKITTKTLAACTEDSELASWLISLLPLPSDQTQIATFHFSLLSLLKTFLACLLASLASASSMKSFCLAACIVSGTGVRAGEERATRCQQEMKGMEAKTSCCLLAVVIIVLESPVRTSLVRRPSFARSFATGTISF